MLDGKSDVSKKCAKVIYNVIAMTRIKNKQGLIEVMEQMCKSSESSSEYSAETRKIYRVVLNFFKHVWKEDLDAIVEISLGKSKK